MLVLIFVAVFNLQMSFVSVNSHLKQDKSPMNAVFKNGDINIDFTQLNLDDKGKDEDRFVCVCVCDFQKTSNECVRQGGVHLQSRVVSLRPPWPI